MTDSKLFKYACYVLGATLLIPVAVYAISLLLGFSGQDPSEYIAEGTKSVFNQIEDKKADKKATAEKDSTKKSDQKADKKADQKSSDKKVAKKSSKASSKKAANAGKKASTYTVKPGDTYGCIAENYYGSLEQWPMVHAANIGGGIGYGVYDLHVGAVLVLPAVSADDMKPASNFCS